MSPPLPTPFPASPPLREPNLRLMHFLAIDVSRRGTRPRGVVHSSTPKVYTQDQSLTGPGIVVSTAVDAYNAGCAKESPTQTMVESSVSEVFPVHLHPYIGHVCRRIGRCRTSHGGHSIPSAPCRHTSGAHEWGRSHPMVPVGFKVDTNGLQQGGIVYTRLFCVTGTLNMRTGCAWHQHDVK